MPGKKYIAQLTGSGMNETIQKYLEEQQITLIKYLKSLNMVIIESERDLLSEEFKYLTNMEIDKPLGKSPKDS